MTTPTDIRALMQPYAEHPCPCLGNPKLAFHGTPEPARVLRDGILKRESSYGDGSIYLARRPDGATAFGTVIQVDLTGIEGSFNNDWQTHVEQDILPDRLSLWDGEPTTILLCDACWERVSMTSPGEGVFHREDCACHDTGLDQRFDALRGEHEWKTTVFGPPIENDTSKHCTICRVQELLPSPESQKWADDNPDEVARMNVALGHPPDWSPYSPPYCLRTDLGALVRVAAACGHDADVGKQGEQWFAFLGGVGEPDITLHKADTPEDALALALVAAVPL